MKLSKIVSLLVLSAALCLMGCMGEDTSDCPPDYNLTLIFSYLNFPDRIDRVTLGIYDDVSGRLVETRQVEKSELNVFQGINLYLSAGDYTAVCWGNAFDNTRIDGLTPGSAAALQEVAHPGYFNSTTIPTNDALYYGIHTFTIIPDVSATETVPFTPAHIRLVVQAQGLASTGPGEPEADYPYIKINNLTPAYDYLMATHGTPVSYYPSATVNTADLMAEAISDVLRFDAINPITIDVIENTTTQAVLHTVNLQSFITAHSINMSAGREITIPILITFSADGMLVSVTLIESWGDQPVIPVTP